MLLHWCTLEPSGSSNIAAIRFSSPVRVKSIRIFPTDAQPFSQCPDIIARTEPEAFYLRVYFNAHPISQSDAREKQKPTNELVPTVVPYAGELMEFTVDMGLEYATRLMIVQGNFESVSMAIYGDIATQLPPSPKSYHPKPVPTLDHIPLSKPLDPSNADDPTLLAKQLLGLTPDPPPLSILIRLMYCVKPSNSDWEHPDFPYLYVDLDQDITDFDLGKACKLTTSQMSDDLSLERLSRFAENIAQAIGPPDSDQSYQIAGLLSNIASQNPQMVKILLGKIDLSKIFEPSHLDKYTLSKLVQAATNADIARHLHTEWFFDVVSNVQEQYAVDRETRSDAAKLIARIQGWQVLEDALSNTQADFSTAAAMLKDIGTHELTFGIWLESMIAHPDIVTRLAENPVLPLPLPYPPLLLRPSLASISHDDFIAFLRAYIGVACVVAVYAWSDSLPNVRCRERTLAILRLWQGVNGYREIVNHFLLIPQMTFRLESMVDNDPPTRQGIDAEKILVTLAYDPQAALSQDLIKCLFSLRQPLSYITEEERLTMRKIASVSEDGLPAAVEEVANLVKNPETMRDVRILRVALAILDAELQIDEEGEWRVLETLWSEGLHGLVLHLANVCITLGRVIKRRFGLPYPTSSSQEFINQIFRAANEALQLLNRLLLAYPPPARALRDWTASVADLFACTDAADMVLAQSSSACVAAQETRQTCIDSMRMLSSSHDMVDVPVSEIVFRALLVHGLQPGDFDPVHHLLQVSCLLDHLIPFPDSDTLDKENTTVWFQRVIPTVLEDLRSFICALDPENKAHFVKRLVNLDNGAIGVGEWLVIEDMKQFHRLLQSFDEDSPHDEHRYQAMLYLRFLGDLLIPSSSVSQWCIAFIESTPEVAQLLAWCFRYLISRRFSSQYMTRIAYTLASQSTFEHDELRFSVCVILLRTAQDQNIDSEDLESSLCLAWDLLKRTPVSKSQLCELRLEIGALISALEPSQIPDELLAIAIAQILEWLIGRFDQPVTLPGLTEVHLDELITQLRHHVPQERVEAVWSKIMLSEEMLDIPAINSLPTKLDFSIAEVEEILHPKTEVASPSTPPLQGQDVIGLVNISPSTILRSPLVTGLTKTYLKNDFRQLRQSTMSRQNTSRLPSMHVDDFELSAASLSPVLRPVADASLPAKPIMPTDVFQSLSPAFSPQ